MRFIATLYLIMNPWQSFTLVKLGDNIFIAFSYLYKQNAVDSEKMFALGFQQIFKFLKVLNRVLLSLENVCL